MSDKSTVTHDGDTGYLDVLIEQARKDIIEAHKRMDDLQLIKSLLPMCMDPYDVASAEKFYCREQAGHSGIHYYRSGE